METCPPLEPILNIYHAAIDDSIADTTASIAAARGIPSHPVRSRIPRPQARSTAPHRTTYQVTTAASPGPAAQTTATRTTATRTTATRTTATRTTATRTTATRTTATRTTATQTTATQTTATRSIATQTTAAAHPRPAISRNPVARATASALPKAVIPRKSVAFANTGRAVPANTRPVASAGSSSTGAGPVVSDGAFSARVGLVAPDNTSVSTANFTSSYESFPFLTSDFLPLMTGALPLPPATAKASAGPGLPAAGVSFTSARRKLRKIGVFKKSSDGRKSKGKAVCKRGSALPVIPEDEPVAHTAPNRTECMERYITDRTSPAQASLTNQLNIHGSPGRRSVGRPLYDSIRMTAGSQLDQATADVEAQLQRDEDQRLQHEEQRETRRNNRKRVFMNIFAPCCGDSIAKKA
ncbi:hypothetical protein GGR53DRAFT_323003 [Hypoxylon sp. FL1150]|nr:hypothetical protein GGR53DRAFT_323003 [Hypoxylon sp. FL1150]